MGNWVRTRARVFRCRTFVNFPYGSSSSLNCPAYMRIVWRWNWYAQTDAAFGIGHPCRARAALQGRRAESGTSPLPALDPRPCVPAFHLNFSLPLQYPGSAFPSFRSFTSFRFHLPVSAFSPTHAIAMLCRLSSLNYVRSGAPRMQSSYCIPRCVCSYRQHVLSPFGRPFRASGIVVFDWFAFLVHPRTESNLII